jgi:hypothetical protein
LLPMGQEVLLGRAALSVPMRQSMPHAGTIDKGRGAVREGQKGAAQDVWPVCMCVWFSGAVLRICTRVLHHCVLLLFGGLLQSLGPLRSVRSHRKIGSPHPIRSLDIRSLSSRVSPLWTQSLRLSVPPGTTTPGTWQRVVMLNLRPSTSVPVSTLQRLTEAAADIRSNDAPAGEDDPTDSVQHVSSDDHQLPARCTTTPPATSTINAACPAIGPSPWPSQLDT